MKIALIVDDEPKVCKHVRMVLDRHGFATFAAHDFASTKARLQRIKPNVIILDVLLDGESGFDLCEDIRSEFDDLDCPILFLTALGGTTDVREGKAAGGDYYLVKPYTEESLIDGIDKATQTWRARTHH